MPVQIFWASPKIWLHLVPLQKNLCRHKNQFYWMQIIFLSGTNFLWLPQYVNKFLVWHKQFGPAQNILGPVKGQGICHWQPIQNLGPFTIMWRQCDIWIAQQVKAPYKPLLDPTKVSKVFLLRFILCLGQLFVYVTVQSTRLFLEFSIIIFKH